MLKISRPCYDKPHRCPGWAGGGTKYGKVDRCPSGSIRVRVIEEEGYEGYPGNHKWRFGYCDTCGIVTWPLMIRWLDVGWWKWKVL